MSASERTSVARGSWRQSVDTRQRRWRQLDCCAIGASNRALCTCVFWNNKKWTHDHARARTSQLKDNNNSLIRSAKVWFISPVKLWTFVCARFCSRFVSNFGTRTFKRREFSLTLCTHTHTQNFSSFYSSITFSPFRLFSSLEIELSQLQRRLFEYRRLDRFASRARVFAHCTN